MSVALSGKLTTHVLDVRLGQPARDLAFAPEDAAADPKAAMQ